MSTRKEMRNYDEIHTKPYEWDQVWDAIVANSRDTAAPQGLRNTYDLLGDTAQSSCFECEISSEEYYGGFANPIENEMHKGSRNDRIRHFGRRFGRHCHTSNYGISPQTRGTLECNIEWHQQSVDRHDCFEDSGRAHVKGRISNPFHSIKRKLSRGREADAYFRSALAGFHNNRQAQSTVEYAIVMAAGLAIVVALGALTNSVEDGMFVQHAIAAASHNVSGFLGGVADVFSY